MGVESYLSKKVKEKIKSVEHRGREYYRVVPKPNTSAQKEIASEWNFEDVYLGDDDSPEHSPRGHPKKIPEQHAERRSKLGQMRVEVHWTSGMHGKTKVIQFDEDTWIFYKAYENGIEVRI